MNKIHNGASHQYRGNIKKQIEMTYSNTESIEENSHGENKCRKDKVVQKPAARQVIHWSIYFDIIMRFV